MTEFDDDFAASALPDMFAQFGGSDVITYNTKDARGVTTATETLDAMIVDRGQVDFETSDGIYVNRAIDVIFKTEDKASAARLDSMSWGGEEWVIIEILPVPGAVHVVCGRHERAAATGRQPYRSTMPVRGEDVG